jgi:hypothetical protein
MANFEHIDRYKTEINTKSGAGTAVLIAPKTKRSWVDDLTGVIPGADVDAKEIKAERLARKAGGGISGDWFGEG